MSLRSLGLFLMVALLATGTRMAAAQSIVGGGTRAPEVQVDLSVLDALGPAPTLPDLLHGQRPPSRSASATEPRATPQTALHAPRQKKKPKTTASAGAKGSKTVASAAARAAAPVKPAAATGGATSRQSVTTTPLAENGAVPKSPPMPELPTAAAPPPAPTLPPAAAAPTPIPAAPPPAPAAPAVAENAAPAATTSPPPAPAPSPPAPSAPGAGGEKLAAASPPPAPAPQPATNAAAPSVVTAVGDRTVRVQFPSGASELPDGAKKDLDRVVQKLQSNDQARLQLVAYAAGGPDDANQARRLSLSRALAVRTYLIAQGVPNSRMDVRALGNRSDGAVPDRVDIVMLDR